jgi:hypothetical protein
MGGPANRVIMDRRSPRHKERYLFIGKRSWLAMLRHEYKATVGNVSARVHGENVWPCVMVMLMAWAPALWMVRSNKLDPSAGADVE